MARSYLDGTARSTALLRRRKIFCAEDALGEIGISGGDLNWSQEPAMSDGREERQEQEQRRQWEQEREREDRLDRYPVDPRRPERRES